MTVLYHSAASITVEGSPALQEWYESAKIRIPGSEFSDLVRRGIWDGYYRPGTSCLKVPGEDRYRLKCSRGLLNRLFSLGLVAGSLPSYFSTAEATALLELLPPTLHDYQRQAITLSLIHGWGRVALATNAGKGAIIALLAAYLSKHKQAKCIILCDEVAVFEALEGEVTKWSGLSPGKVESGTKLMPTESVVIAMVPTLSKRLADSKDPEGKKWRKWVQSFTAAFLDEADKATAATWKKILGQLKNSVYRIGFSGTFLEADPSKALHNAHMAMVSEELMGPVLIQIQNKDLIERQISAKPRVMLYGYNPRVGRIWKTDGWWAMTGAERRRLVFERIVHNQERHEFIRDEVLQPGVPTCIIITHIEHGEELEQTIPGSVFLSGRDSKGQRSRTLDQFQSGEIPTLIVTKILDRGSNRLGHTTDLIFASGEGSPRQVLQRIGRGLRRGGGKEFLRLADVIDRGNDYLADAARSRIQIYHEQGFEVDVHRYAA